MNRTLVILGVLAVGCGAGRVDVALDGGVPDATTTVDASPPPPASLSSLVVSTGVLDPTFAPSVAEYDLDLLFEESMVELTATAADPAGAIIAVDAVPVASGTASIARTFAPGSRDLEISVSNVSGSMTYRVHVHRGVDVLSELSPERGVLAPVFAPAITAYAIALPQATETVAFTPVALIPARAQIAVGGVPIASGAASEAQPLQLGSNAQLITVTPRSRPGDVRSYTIDAGRGSDALASIRLSYADGAVVDRLAPAFDPSTHSYAVSVGFWLRAVQITVTPLVTGGSITIDGSPVQAGLATAPLALPFGLRTIDIVITAPDGASGTYTLDIIRAARVEQRDEMFASNATPWDLFGETVALDGDTLVVGSEWESSAATGIDGDQFNIDAPGSGAVYVFARVAGRWSQQAYLKASNTDRNDHFGASVAVSGDTIAVGAWGEGSKAHGVGGDQLDNSLSSAGAVYVFRRANGAWTQEAYVKASNPARGAGFANVALDGDTLVVGALGEDSAATGVDGDQTSHGAPSSGAAYIFTRQGATWSQRAYLKASNTGPFDLFGSAVAVWGDTVVVGAPLESSGVDPATDDVDKSGAVYVFTRNAGTWSHQAMLKALLPDAGAMFGASIALWQTTLVVGAPHSIGSHIGIGSVDIFERNDAVWGAPHVRIAQVPHERDHFGSFVSLWGDTLVVGVEGDASGAAGVDGDPGQPGGPILAGAAQVFARDAGSWVPETYLKAASPAQEEDFCVVAVSGDTIVVGAPGTGGPEQPIGSLYVFQ
jgi:hypothetical protein